MNKAAFYLVSGSIAKGTATSEHYMDVMFNPDTYSVESTAEYSSATDISARMDFLQFSKLSARTLTLDLYFDTVNGSSGMSDIMSGVSAQLKELFFNSAEDVRPMIDKLHKLIELQNNEETTPPVVEFQWGSFRFRGVITSMKEKYDMFLPDGRPVKATVSVTMRDYFGMAKEIREAMTAAQSAANSAVASSEKESFTETAKTLVESVV